MVMPAHTYRATLTFDKKSMIPQDRVDWDFHFDHAGGAPLVADFTNLSTALQHFLSSTAALAVSPVQSYLARCVQAGPNAVQARYYLLPPAVGPTGPPEYTTSLSLAIGAGDSLPDETSVCLSYEAGVLGVPEFGPHTRPRARRRNRTYIGPLSTSVLQEDAITHEAFVSSTIRQALTESAHDFLFVEAAAAGWNWDAFSRTDWTVRAVEACWVDNAFDTQRRRGNLASTRTFRVL